MATRVVARLSRRHIASVGQKCQMTENSCLYTCAQKSLHPFLQPKVTPVTFYQQQRFILPKFPSPFRSKKGKVLEYSESRVIGFSREQMYSVVADVTNYEQFVPFCTKSVVESSCNGVDRCTLCVGFPPIVEKYTSWVTMEEPDYVKSEAHNTRLFNHLKTTWQFAPGHKDMPSTCCLNFTVSFQFHSAMYAQLAQMFFNEIVRSNVNAFLKRAEHLYGPPSIAHSKKISQTNVVS
ncbi:hypothetical protein NP493_1435g00061 [Ridgeia piscesae]|uniref:Coenzyme Q-binding protein COQ10 START domain-containing protein n=1 Tax=Ridgeia piscesae TaxID=27915 RepID=A0AAD9ND77_RIDPI|nr:hypothetical protein NP493_1435g00061 [Ridgeia piscesae]